MVQHLPANAVDPVVIFHFEAPPNDAVVKLVPMDTVPVTDR